MDKFATDVIEFNTKVLGIDPRPVVANMSQKEMEFTTRALTEEVAEFIVAANQGMVVAQIDALIDLMYFAVGGLHKLGLTAEQIGQCARAVHMSNMTKKRGVKTSRGDGTVPDAVKSEEWLGPEQRILRIILGGE